MKITKSHCPEIYAAIFCDSKDRKLAIKAGMSSRDLTKDMIRVKSSNVWAYNINVRKNGDSTGDLYVQFKGDNGGPGDIYVYYDVPVKVYSRWGSAPSKGHYFWQHIRGKYKYAKLTGDKKTKMKGGVNTRPEKRDEPIQAPEDSAPEEMKPIEEGNENEEVQPQA